MIIVVVLEILQTEDQPRASKKKKRTGLLATLKQYEQREIIESNQSKVCITTSPQTQTQRYICDLK